MSRQTPIIPIFRAPPVLSRRAFESLELREGSLHKREHLLRDHRARCARDGVEDVRELQGGKDESPSLRFAFPCLARDELFERYRLARDPLAQFGDLLHEAQALGLVRFAAQLDEKGRDPIRVDSL
jgi:hypothetical protein